MTNSRQIERTAAAWLARRDAGAWSADDQAQLTAWLECAVAHRIAFIRLEAAWEQSGRLKALGAGIRRGTIPARGRWATSPLVGQQGSPTHKSAAPRHHGEKVRHAPGPWRHLGYTAAAAVLLTTALTLGWHRYAAVDEATYHTAIGTLQVVELADGSTATLNSNSRMHVVLSRGKRAIDLQQGEAFFEVAKDPARPFVVSANRRRVTAVGTAFAVRRGDGDLRVVVTHGVVRLEAATGPGDVRQATTLLPAGSVAMANATGVLVQSGTVQQARDFLSWRDGYLSFHDTPLAAAAAEFNRYNTRKIIIGDPGIGALRVGGNFRWSNADAFVRLLEQGFPIQAVRHGDATTLKHR